jgi:hypothetical protein
MSEHEHTEPEQDEREDAVEDLDVPEGQTDDVSGGGTNKTGDITLKRGIDSP